MANILGWARSHTQPETCLDIYYNNVRNLDTKQFEININIGSVDLM